MFQRQGYKTSDEKGSSQWEDKNLGKGYNGLFDGSVCTINWKKKEQSTKYKYQPSRDTKVKPPQYNSRIYCNRKVTVKRTVTLLIV